MAHTDQVDLLLQFHLTVLQDLQHRLLNAAPLTTLWVNSPLSRRIEQAVPPLEVKACWNKPGVMISDGGVTLAADLTGGARQALSGRILTLDGSVSARQTLTSAVDTSQRPYACVEQPTPVQVDLRQLKVSYEGSRWPARLSTLNPAKEATALRPVLASELFEQLARIPLTCMPCSLPLRMPNQEGMVAAGTLPLKRVIPGFFATPASVALGLLLDDQHAAPSLFVGVMPPQSPYNAAIALSEHGLNALLSHFCARGAATGQLHHPQFGKIEWRWEKLSVKLRQDALAVNGLLVQQGMKRAVVAELKSTLVNTGCLQSHLVSSNLDMSGAETLLAAWNGVLTLLLRARAANSQDQEAQDAARLFQCFALPTSAQTIESVAQELLVTDEQLILYYTLPTSVQEVPLEIPPPKPSVSITQPHLPQQTAQGAPVTIKLDAQILKDSTPPYDFAWTSDLSPNPVPQFGATYTISAVPDAATAAGAGPQTLTTARLKVIDMFGQVAQTQAKAQYLPARKKQQPSPEKVLASRASAPQWVIGSLPKWLLVALAGLVVLAASGITFALIHRGGGGTPPPPGTIFEFSLPTVGSGPYAITAGPDGTLWFTEITAGKIGRITPDGKITEFSLPTIDSAPRGITLGPDGNLWFTEDNGNAIGRITPGGKIAEFSIPTADCKPVDITTGPDGNLWFTEDNGSKIGRITPGGKITEFSLPATYSYPYGITAGPDGTLWFTDGGGGSIGRITPGGAITEFPIAPHFYGNPYGITAGPDGTLWFTESNNANGSGIGRITTDGTITAFSFPTASPGDITTGPDGNLWFTDMLGAADQGSIGRITSGGTITEFPLPIDCGPAGGCGPTGITKGPDGNLWFTEYNTNKIGRITPGGKITGFSAPTDLASDASGARTAGLLGTFFLLIQFDGPFVRRTPAR